MKKDTWNILDDDGRVLYREYRFTKGAYATTFAFRGTDGLVVVSPGSNMDARAYDALREHGEVSALVANNAWHHLGQAAWRERFPDAVSYAPRETVAALAKRAPSISFRPLDELALPEDVHYATPPGFKSGECFFSVRARKGPIWFAGDLFANLPRTPPAPVGWLFSLSGSAPGFRLFKLAAWLMVRDKRAVKEWMLERLASEPPAVVVPGHGPAFEAEDLTALARAQLERL
ncbi:MAG: hypothetical protein KF764_02690 [Labilithrix sp.]|nr:hypothetical protein [Labilithrix sp.]